MWVTPAQAAAFAQMYAQLASDQNLTDQPNNSDGFPPTSMVPDSMIGTPSYRSTDNDFENQDSPTRKQWGTALVDAGGAMTFAPNSYVKLTGQVALVSGAVLLAEDRVNSAQSPSGWSKELSQDLKDIGSALGSGAKDALSRLGAIGGAVIDELQSSPLLRLLSIQPPTQDQPASGDPSDPTSPDTDACSSLSDCQDRDVANGGDGDGGGDD